MMDISAIPTVDLKLAAAAWRRNANEQMAARGRSGLFRFLVPKPDMDLYNKIDDLVAEVERLRWNEHLHRVKQEAVQSAE